MAAVIAVGSLAVCDASASAQQMTIQNGANSACLDADTVTMGANGTHVQLWQCNGTIEQQWYVDQLGSGLQIRSADSGRCLDADTNTASLTATIVQLWDCNGRPQQQWTQNGALLANALNGHVLDADRYALSQNGTPVQLLAAGQPAQPQQQWRATPETATVTADPSQITVPDGTTRNINLSWTAPSAAAQVLMVSNGGAPQLIAGGASGVKQIAVPQGNTRFLVIWGPDPTEPLGVADVTGISPDGRFCGMPPAGPGVTVSAYLRSRRHARHHKRARHHKQPRHHKEARRHKHARNRKHARRHKHNHHRRAHSQLVIGYAAPRARTNLTADYAAPVNATGTARLANGQPAAGEKICVVSRWRSPGAPSSQLGPITTDAAGRFTYRVPSGPSRTLSFVAPTAGGPVTDTVTLTRHAHVALRPKRNHLRNGERLTLLGHIPKPVPAGGVVVDIQVQRGRQWQTFETVKANRRGRFVAHYTFRRTTEPTVYPMRALVPSQSAVYPYARSESRHIPIHVRR